MTRAHDTAQTTDHDGGCLCGAIRYRLTEPIAGVFHCHCHMCHRAGGALAITWLSLPRNRFAVTKGVMKFNHSSAPAERGFCPSCGSQLIFRSEKWPEDMDVTLGTLDHPEQHPASSHVWTSSKISWLHLDERLPSFAEFSSGGAET